VRRCGVFELFNLRRSRSSPAHRVSSPLSCIRGAFSCNGLVKSLRNIFCQYNHPRLKRNHRNRHYTAKRRRLAKSTLTYKRLIEVSIYRPQSQTCVKSSPLSLLSCPFWPDVPDLGRHLVSSRCRHRWTLAMHHREPMHTGLRRRRTHVRDLQSSLEVHRRRPHNTLMNMEERRAR